MNMSQILSISRSGLNAYQREMDVVSNNLANVDTLGYKDKRTTFQELLNNGTNANEVGLSQNAGNVAINAGLNVQQVNENLSQGAFKSTAGTYDLAIDGEGYFGVRDGANNLYLTRDGSFRRDADGNFVTSKGMKVEVQSNVPSSQWPKDGEVSISTSGYVSIGNVRVGRILLFRPQNSIDMNDIGNNLYRCDGNLISSANTNAGFGQINQGMVELSNVDVADTMSKMIITQRAYQMNSKALQSTDEMLQTINKFTE
ncbi:flagellar basal body rod protein [Ligilactobacillus ruminis SPM0211]|uniref:Flagellar basal body rod protein n=1 Tax=Ligilactobacillus ruminis SPM0211 TaxID=1040964 RepID=F7R0Q3_9LACO|nr:flagellar hook-basal body protein [Ligilactobacillus ruminis]EGM51629.1 flagellar basal body rod protein [Ligilactobacillus ruminis SPM0211]